MLSHEQMFTPRWQQESVATKGILKGSPSKLGKTTKPKYRILVYFNIETYHAYLIKRHSVLYLKLKIATGLRAQNSCLKLVGHLLEMVTSLQIVNDFPH